MDADDTVMIGARIGERNGLRMHFGPTNVTVWRLGIGVELGEGGRAYEQATQTPLDVAALHSQERSSALHFDLARALVQDGAQRDAEAIRHLDTADRLSPTRVRPDRPRPGAHPGPAGPAPDMGTGQPAPPLRHPRATLTICAPRR